MIENSTERKGALYANLVTTTFKSSEDLTIAVKELKEKVMPEIQKIPTIKLYLLIKISETQVVSFGLYDSEQAAKTSFDRLIPYFGPIVTPRVNEQPQFRGGEILTSIFRD